MDDAFAVRAVQGQCDLFQQLRDGVPGKTIAALETLGQGLAFDVRHRQKHLAVDFAKLVERTNIGMMQGGSRFGLAEKPVGRIGFAGRFGELQRDLATELGVLGQEYFAHSTFAEFPENPEFAETMRVADRRVVSGKDAFGMRVRACRGRPGLIDRFLIDITGIGRINTSLLDTSLLGAPVWIFG